MSILEHRIMMTRSQEELDRAIQLYRDVLRIDSTFACTLLSNGPWRQVLGEHHMETEHIKDSLLILANKALSLSDQVEEAYLLRGIYYRYAESEVC